MLKAQPIREAGTKAVRPQDAATVIIWRRNNNHAEVLMGERSREHKFLPQRYVFPGGRVDNNDSRVRTATELSVPVTAQLGRTTRRGRAKSIAIAAIRETFEETGLIIGGEDPSPHRPSPKGWEKFFSAGYAPALDRLEYIARAVTPVFRPIRFDARFFMIHADYVVGDLKSSGELENLEWIPFHETQRFELAIVTRNVLSYAEGIIKAPKLQSPRRKIPYFKHLNGCHHQKIMQ